MIEEFEKNPLWPILVETVHHLVLYANHKAYIRDIMLLENPDITPREAARKLGMPLGEALVIFHELKREGYLK
jgi:hypothetical protein